MTDTLSPPVRVRETHPDPGSLAQWAMLPRATPEEIRQALGGVPAREILREYTDERTSVTFGAS